MADYIDWTGQSGRQYRYWFLSSLASAAIKAEPGNYMFVRKTGYGWLPVYIGIAEKLNERIPNHERWAEAIRLGATHVMAHTATAGAESRSMEERDLILNWDPPLNTHHRQVS